MVSRDLSVALQVIVLVTVILVSATLLHGYFTGKLDEPRYFVCVGYDDSKYKVAESELRKDKRMLKAQGKAGDSLMDVYVPVSGLVGCGAFAE